MTRERYPNVGPARPLSELEVAMDVGYVEETCGWCGVHLMRPSTPLWEGQLICLNMCNISTGAYRNFQVDMAEAWRRTREQENSSS